jgi:hypothetical protein
MLQRPPGATLVARSPASVAARLQRRPVAGRDGRSASAGTVERMQATIFFDASAASDPDVADRLAHLADSGHRLVLVADRSHPAAGLPAWSRVVANVPDSAPRGSWYLTADPATCGDRRPGLRTVLIGPREAPRPTRCDTSARDLRDAVLKILTADAMS